MTGHVGVFESGVGGVHPQAKSGLGAAPRLTSVRDF